MAKTIIRHATFDDLDALMDMALSMHAESPRFSRLSLSQPKVLNLMVTLINSKTGLLLVAEQDGQPIGLLAAMIAAHWFSEELIANEFAVFILPEHRGGMTAVRIIRRYIAWSQENGIKPGWIQLGVSTGVHTDETVALYHALGLKQFSVGFEV